MEKDKFGFVKNKMTGRREKLVVFMEIIIATDKEWINSRSEQEVSTNKKLVIPYHPCRLE